jgi:hypothetical protein
MHIITSFGPGGWEKYAKRMVESYVQYWPKTVPLYAYYHDCEKPEGKYPGVEFINLNENSPEFNTFRERASKANGQGPDGKYNYRFDALKFSAKVFAIGHRLSVMPARAAAGRCGLGVSQAQGHQLLGDVVHCGAGKR